MKTHGFNRADGFMTGCLYMINTGVKHIMSLFGILWSVSILQREIPMKSQKTMCEIFQIVRIRITFFFVIIFRVFGSLSSTIR